MMKLTQTFMVLGAGLLLAACGGGTNNEEPAEPVFLTEAALGESLFHDTSLSLNRTQSCATCHSPDHAFTDPRTDDQGRVSAVSLGDDGVSLGDRNTPTALYASLTPDFTSGSRTRFNSQQDDYSGFIGGQFLDGRATDLQAQAKGPFLNPVEMGMPNAAAVIERVKENPDYIEAFESFYGASIFDNTDDAYDALADAIAEFESTDVFTPFTSRYDRSLEGDYTYDPLSAATTGKSLFFSQQFTNCATCHQLKANSRSDETFSGFEYHNIGVPVNEGVRARNGKGGNFTDNGLLENNAVSAAAEAGKFKVPTLRNAGVTAPYMHNGVFRELATVIKFYDHHLSGSDFTINPETGVAWAEPEVAENISTTELQDGSNLSEDDVFALVCFIYSLTDAQYEDQLPEDAAECGL